MTIPSEIFNNSRPLDTIAPQGLIGLIALAMDFNSGLDLRRMYPNSRVWFAHEEF